jgi:rhodanese-related sulfurtransferase
MVTSFIRRALATGGALVAVAAFAGANKAEPFSMVSMDEVEKMLGQPDVYVVDANPEEVFKQNHLPGARWWRSAPLAKLLPAEKDRRLVFYCASPT